MSRVGVRPRYIGAGLLICSVLLITTSSYVIVIHELGLNPIWTYRQRCDNIAVMCNNATVQYPPNTVSNFLYAPIGLILGIIALLLFIRRVRKDRLRSALLDPDGI